MSEPKNDVADWWTTGIIDMAPGEIRFRGYPIEDLIGSVSFAQMIWLMTRGELPTEAEAPAFGMCPCCGGGSWAAGPVDCDGANGGDLWSGPERRDGVGGQHA